MNKLHLFLIAVSRQRNHLVHTVKHILTFCTQCDHWTDCQCSKTAQKWPWSNKARCLFPCLCGFVYVVCAIDSDCYPLNRMYGCCPATFTAVIDCWYPSVNTRELWSPLQDTQPLPNRDQSLPSISVDSIFLTHPFFFPASFLFFLLSPSSGSYIPRCTEEGYFKPTQCHSSTGQCWCVDKYGNELAGSRKQGNPNCGRTTTHQYTHPVCPLSLCNPVLLRTKEPANQNLMYHWNIESTTITSLLRISLCHYLSLLVPMHQWFRK